MVEVGHRLPRRTDLANLTYKLGDIEQVPLPDQSVDLAILSQALHHAHPSPGRRQRGLPDPAPGRAAPILDLDEHGFRAGPRALCRPLAWLYRERAARIPKKAGFMQVEVSLASREAAEPFFETLLASAGQAGTLTPLTPTATREPVKRLAPRVDLPRARHRQRLVRQGPRVGHLHRPDQVTLRPAMPDRRHAPGCRRRCPGTAERRPGLPAISPQMLTGTSFRPRPSTTASAFDLSTAGWAGS